MTHHHEPPAVYGLMAEFLHPEEVVEAAQHAYGRGFRSMDAYSPMPVDGLAEAIGFRRNRVPLVVLIGGLSGAFIAFFMQWYSSVIDYPLIIGGKPYNSWPSFIVITFELTILGAALSAAFGMLAMNGLPRPHHPVFNAPNFAMASRSRFFLCILANDPLFDLEDTRQFLQQFKPREISVVHR